MHWISNLFSFQQMLEGWGEVQRLGRYLGAEMSGGKTGTILHTVHQSAPSEINQFVCLASTLV
jgi:hypothetical protein